MTWDEAVIYCEEHECTECTIYTEGLDMRTQEEKQNHTPCCKNLVTEKKMED